MLTEKAIRTAMVKEKRYEICDSQGLYLLIAPTGRKSWMIRQQAKAGIKPFKKIIGAWPEMGLFEARQCRDEIIDQQKRRTTGGLLFCEIAADWLEVKCRPRVTAKTVLKYESRLRRYVNPFIGEIVISEITPRELLAVLRKIEEIGYKDIPTDVAQMLGMIFRYGVAIGACDRDITQDLKGALVSTPETHHASITKPSEIGGLMRSIYSLPDGPVKWSILTVAYTMLRSGEVRNATWEEIDFSTSTWTIPAERMKMRRPHIVPISRQVFAILKMARIYAKGSIYVFPTVRTLTRPLSDMAMLAALRRLGYGKTEMSMHGFRSMASTRLNEIGWPVDAIERQLAHIEGNAVRAAYNYAQYLDVRRNMLQWYADYLDALRDGRPIPQI